MRIIKILIVLLPFYLILAQNQDELNKKMMMAKGFEQSGQFDKAMKVYEELHASEPSNPSYYSALNNIYVQLKNYAASVDLLERCILLNPQDISTFGMLGSTYFLTGNETKAKEIWLKPFKSGNPDPVFYRVVADYALERRAFDIAIDLYKEGKEISEDKIIFSYDLGNLYALTMQHDLATEEYCTILDSNPLELQNVQSKIFSYINKPGALESSLEIVEDWSEKSNLSLSYLLAHLYTEADKYDKAFDIYLKIDEAQSNKGADLYRYADYLLKERQYTLAKATYKELIDRYSNSPFLPMAKLGIAKALEAELFEEYKSIIPAWKPYFPIIKYESKKIDDVVEAFNEIIRVYGFSEASYEAMLRIGTIKFYLSGKSEEAKDYFKRILIEAPASVMAAESNMELGRIFLIEGDLNEAEKYFLSVLKIRSMPIELKTQSKYQLARLNLYKQDFESAKSFLIEVTENLKDDFANDALSLSLLLNTSMNDSLNIIRFANAEFLADQKKFTEAAEEYKILSEVPQALVLHSITTLRYAQMMLAVDNYNDAITALEAIVVEGKKNIFADKALYLTGKTYEYGIGDKLKAIESYEKLLLDFPKSIYLDEARKQIILLKKQSS